MGTEQTTDMQGFNRDFQVGDTGDDVVRFQKLLLQYSPNLDKDTTDAIEEEMKKKLFGTATKTAAERLKEEQEQNPGAFAKDAGLSGFINLLLQLVFQIDPNEKSPDDQTGTHLPIAQYSNRTPAQLDAIAAVAPKARAGQSAEQNASAAADLARQYIGEHEDAGNRGDIVKKFCNGQDGIPWCGGFVDYVMKNTYGSDHKIYGQENPLSALGYLDYAKQNGAAEDAHAIPHVGDVVVFKRKGGGHVGIVSEVDSDGTVKYISGNCCDAVRESTYNYNQPPESLAGYSDTARLAENRGIALNSHGVAHDAPTYAYSPPVLQHADKDFARG